MKIKILNHEGRTIPLVFCDLCDKVVDGSKPAEYLIFDAPEGEYSEPIVGHTACTKEHEKQYFKQGSSSIPGNMSLGHLLYCLIANTKTNFEEEKKAADMLDLL